jgi:hypothetical protein
MGLSTSFGERVKPTAELGLLDEYEFVVHPLR